MTTAPSDRPAILVSGGAGYIGAQTCKALWTRGYLPVTLDNLSTGHKGAVKWGPLYVGDVRDAELVRDVVGRHGVLGAIHFAASSIVSESVSDPIGYFDNNLVGSIAFVKALIECGVKAFVFSSTAAVYGAPSLSPIREDAGTAPLNPYGASKLAVESALPWLAGAGVLRWTALRYFNAAGGDPEGDTGESHHPETHLIPNLIRAALGAGPGLTLFGDDYPTPDGSAVRDYIHVVDLAEAHVLAIRALLEGAEGGIMNVGTGAGVSVKAMIAAAQAVLEMPVPYVVGPRRAGDPPSLVADASLLSRTLGWTPRRSDIHSILRDAALWERTRGW